MTLRELLTNRYAPVKGISARTVAIYGHTIDRFSEYLGREALVTDLEEDTIAAFLAWRGKTVHSARRGIPSAGTVRKDRTQLLALATYGFRKRLIEEFPIVRQVRGAKKLPRGFTAAEVARLIVAARQRQRTLSGLPAGWWWSTLIYAAVCTGERFEALTSLRWGQVDLDRRRVVFLAGTRKGSTRDIERAVTPQLAAMLAEHRRGPGDLVWPWDRATRSHWASLQVLCRSAGVEYRGRGFHGFRRMAASYAALAGGAAAATQLLDHSDPALQAVYVDPLICPRDTCSVDTLPPLDIGEPAAG